MVKFLCPKSTQMVLMERFQPLLSAVSQKENVLPNLIKGSLNHALFLDESVEKESIQCIKAANLTREFQNQGLVQRTLFEPINKSNAAPIRLFGLRNLRGQPVESPFGDLKSLKEKGS